MSVGDPKQSNAMGNAATPPAKTIWWWMSRFSTAGQVLLAGICLIFFLGVAQRIGWIGGTDGGAKAANAGGAKAEIYTCPMHPQIRQPGPGRCPICAMPLVPATSGLADLDELAVTIQPAQRRLANIQTAKVEKVPVSTTLQTIGAIQMDESRMATIASYIDGRVERLFADYTGVQVKSKDHLAIVYSPQLYAAQVEYVESRQTLDRMTSGVLAAVRDAQSKLVASSRQKLVELGMTEEQLTELESKSEPKSRLTIYAPMGGTVIEKMAIEGMYIKAGEPIYRIANLSTVWLMLELFPEDAARVRFGQQVEAELTSLPGETLKGRIAFIDPTVDKSKRTVGVRVEFTNDLGMLRPGDYAQATIEIPVGPQGEVYDEDLAGKWISPMHPQVIRNEPGDCPICGMPLVPTTRYGYATNPVSQKASLVVPRSAVLLAGDNSVVYVEEKPGRFEIRTVKLGPILRDRVVIVEGLREGEMAATAGNFLIDSQMQLAGKPSLIDPTKAVAAQQERKSPLELIQSQTQSIGGKTGQQLEQFYAAYFQIQKAYAQDKTPAASDVQQLHQLATELAESADLDEKPRELLREAAAASEHLHHLSLEKGRHDAFRPLSHAVVQLAAIVRGDQAEQMFFHVFCPMVKGGAGDWLQNENKVHNPYFGSAMANCGDVEHELAPADKSPGTKEAPRTNQGSTKGEEQ